MYKKVLNFRKVKFKKNKVFKANVSLSNLKKKIGAKEKAEL